MLSNCTKGVLGYSGRGHGPLQQPGEKRENYTFGQGGEIHVPGYIRKRYHHVLSYHL